MARNLRHQLLRVCIGLALASTAVAAQSVSGGQGRGGGGAAAKPDAAAPATGVPQEGQRTTVIAIRDYVQVMTLDEPRYSGKFVVELDGTIGMPYLGRIKAAGFTQRELAAEITKQLKAGYMNDPQVSVELEQTANKRVIVTGPGVRSPNEYPYAGQMSVLQALARAGNTTDDASDVALVLRAPGTTAAGEPDTVRVNLIDLMAGSRTEDIPLHDGDTIIVNKMDPVYVTGEVKSVGAIRVPKGTTVQQLIALAGGLTPLGKWNGIKIERTVNGKKVETEIKNEKMYKTEQVKPGDNVTVPKKIM